jgi:hypothetical protein
MQELPVTGIAAAAIQDNTGACPKFLLMDGIGSSVVFVPGVFVFAVLADSFFFTFSVINHVFDLSLIKAK